MVVKVGTSTLLDEDQRLDLNTIRRLLEEMVRLKSQGRSVVFVSSGAIGAGLGPLGFQKRPDTIEELQAAAAVGQLLLTHGDFQDRRRYLNMRNMLIAMERHRVLPVINENDTVAVDEIRFGDNDTLAGLVANAVDADVTVLLSDVDGFYVDGRPLDEVGEVTEALEAAAGGTSGLGSGGMITKINAAKVVTAAGGYLLIAHGRKHPLTDLLDGKPLGTLFRPSGTRLDHRKRWIAHTLKEAGALTIDDGGAEALRRKGSSLLSVGVTGCDGDFETGDAVLVRDRSGRAIAKGLVNYSAQDLRRIMGRRTEEIEGILGYRPSDEIVHRDNMVILG